MKDTIITIMILTLLIGGGIVIGDELKPVPRVVTEFQTRKINILTQQQECNDKGGKFSVYTSPAYDSFHQYFPRYIELSCDKSFTQGNIDSTEHIFDIKINY